MVDTAFLFLGGYQEILAYAALECTAPTFKDTRCRSTDITFIQVFEKYTVGVHMGVSC